MPEQDTPNTPTNKQLGNGDTKGPSMDQTAAPPIGELIQCRLRLTLPITLFCPLKYVNASMYRVPSGVSCA